MWKNKIYILPPVDMGWICIWLLISAAPLSNKPVLFGWNCSISLSNKPQEKRSRDWFSSVGKLDRFIVVTTWYHIMEVILHSNTACDDTVCLQKTYLNGLGGSILNRVFSSIFLILFRPPDTVLAFIFLVLLWSVGNSMSPEMSGMEKRLPFFSWILGMWGPPFFFSCMILLRSSLKTR